MEKFKQRPDETLLRKGSMAYVQGEPGVKNYLKGKTSVTECTGILTSQRFVACKKRKYFPWGPLVWLFMLLSKRKIVFTIPLSSFASIKDDGVSAIWLRASNGSGYRMVWTSLLAKKERAKWTQAITDAVVEACPGTKAQVTESFTEFAKSR